MANNPDLHFNRATVSWVQFSELNPLESACQCYKQCQGASQVQAVYNWETEKFVVSVIPTRKANEDMLNHTIFRKYTVSYSQLTPFALTEMYVVCRIVFALCQGGYLLSIPP